MSRNQRCLAQETRSRNALEALSACSRLCEIFPDKNRDNDIEIRKRDQSTWQAMRLRIKKPTISVQANNPSIFWMAQSYAFCYTSIKIAVDLRSVNLLMKAQYLVSSGSFCKDRQLLTHTFFFVLCATNQPILCSANLMLID